MLLNCPIHRFLCKQNDKHRRIEAGSKGRCGLCLSCGPILKTVSIKLCQTVIDSSCMRYETIAGAFLVDDISDLDAPGLFDASAFDLNYIAGSGNNMSQNGAETQQAFTVPSGDAFLVIREGDVWGEVITLTPGQVITVGRAPTNRVVLHDEICSRNHCEIFQSNSKWVLRDLESRNGTRVDNSQVEGDWELFDGEMIQIGRCALGFTYDPAQTFRGWLRRVVENAIVDFLRQQGKRMRSGQTVDEFRLDEVAAKKDLFERLEEAFDLELLEVAQQRVQARVEPKRWQAWELTAMQQLSGDEVSQRLEMKVATIYTCRFQIQKMIAAEVQLLESDAGSQVQARG